MCSLCLENKNVILLLEKLVKEKKITKDIVYDSGQSELLGVTRINNRKIELDGSVIKSLHSGASVFLYFSNKNIPREFHQYARSCGPKSIMKTHLKYFK